MTSRSQGEKVKDFVTTAGPKQAKILLLARKKIAPPLRFFFQITDKNSHGSSVAQMNKPQTHPKTLKKDAKNLYFFIF